MLAENYELSTDVIRGIFTEEEAQSLKSKPISISYGALEYGHCMMAEYSEKPEEAAEHYYCSI
jgi:hypothetical protein